MSLDPGALVSREFPRLRIELSALAAVTYALSIGFGESGPVNGEQHVTGVSERTLAVPFLGNVLGYPGFWWPETGADWKHVVHAEQRLRVHALIPQSEPLIAETRVISVVDRGATGLFVSFRTDIRGERSGALIVSKVQTEACLRDGGVGSEGEAPAALAPIPGTTTDTVIRVRVPANAALLYQLNGDYNPLHTDPEVAAEAGYERPILHGLCTLGRASRAIEGLGAYRTSRLAALDARFAAALAPGEEIDVEVWQLAEGCRFRVRAVEGGRTVIDRGFAAFV